MNIAQSQEIIVWISPLRIFATLLIFVFHFMGLFGLNRYRIDIFGISIFCFISGFLIYPMKEPTGKWLEKKYLQIMLPFWIVMIVVIIINYFIGYKHKQIYELLIILFTGGMFVHDPLYVISWYITFTLSLYGMFALCNSVKNNYLKFLYFLISTAIYIIINQPYVYAFSFIFGILLKKYKIIKSKEIQTVPNRILFSIQNRCYSFFLIHGGVLLFFVKVIPLSPTNCFVISLSLTCALAYFHYEISNNIIKIFRIE